MTNTPRTRAELLTDFADNQNHGITPQKMRNLVVSTKLQQVTGDGAVWHETGFAGAGTWPLSIANQAPDNDVKIALTPNGTNPVPDTTGAMQSGSYVSSYYGQTFGAYEWARLPAGLWFIQFASDWDPNSTGFRYVQAETMDDRINIVSPVTSDFWGYPGQWGELFAGPQFHTAAARPQFANNSQIIGVPESLVALSDAHSTAGQGLAISFWAHQSSGGPLNLNYVRLLAIRLNSLA